MKTYPLMSAEIKYLSVGVFIGIGTTALLLTGMLLPPTVANSLQSVTAASTSTEFVSAASLTPTRNMSTNTFTFTPTFIQPTGTTTPTHTPTLTPTVPSPTPSLSISMLSLLKSGYLSQRGYLSLEQQVDLYSSSLKFIRNTTRESHKLGNSINGVGYGSPTDICGPLSIAILQDTGLVRTNLDPHDFWLLNPDVPANRKLLNTTFPSILHENIRFNINLGTMDWNDSPLYPGDFLYIYAGSSGNFEHMLVVNRVDAEGRAYSVTNYNTTDGFVIGETLLYDPADSSAGIFPLWTARPLAKMGATGFGGFEVWRYRLP